MQEQTDYTEKELVKQLVAGDEYAFTRIYEMFHPLLFHHAFALLKLKPAAEDVCNETFLNLWKNRQTLAEVNCLKAYLLTAVRNHALNTLKKLTRSQAAKQEIVNAFPDTSFSSEEHLLEKEYAEFIHKSISHLPSRAQEVFTLCRQEGFSYNEVAAQLGISRNAVKHHMVVSIKKLALLAKKEFGISCGLFLFFFLLENFFTVAPTL